MSNLRTILEEYLVKSIGCVCLAFKEGECFCSKAKLEAEQKIKELMLDEDEIFIFISTGRADKNENKVRGYVESRYVEKIASAIHSAMLKKLED